GVVPWVLSGRTESALRAQAGKLLAHVREGADVSVVDVGYSLALTRSRFEHRAAVVASEREGFVSVLEALAEGRPVPGVVRGAASAGDVRPVFV
ncbi:hypothetical protein, partial [Streptomyces sp. KLOTTS4A1]|uniref:CurL C-terminal domain-containing protein n=1 Tax=Streptomyces sp. KLOTTS4A1 TaxID=3390996 RepID=UPI0039F54C75